MSLHKQRSTHWRRFLTAPWLMAGMIAAMGLVTACAASQPAPTPTTEPSKPAAAPTQPAAAPTKAPAQPTPAAQAQAWVPKSEITFVVPMAPGGAQDPISRLLAQESEPLLKQKVVVVNKPGAASTVGTADVIQSKPDGYKIGLSTAAAVAWEPQVGKLPYKDTNDYTPIIKLSEIPATVAVRPDAPWKNIKDFVEDARQRPGKLSVTVSGRYSGSDLPLWRLKLLTKVDFNNVPAGSGGEALTRVLGGHADAVSSTPVNIRPQAEAGKLRVMAVFQKGRNAFFPDVPSPVELGYDVTLPIVYFVIGPKGLDKTIVDSYYRVFSEVLKSPKFQQFAKENGYTLDPIGPEELRKELQQLEKQYGELIRELKVEVKK